MLAASHGWTRRQIDDAALLLRDASATPMDGARTILKTAQPSDTPGRRAIEVRNPLAPILATAPIAGWAMFASGMLIAIARSDGTGAFPIILVGMAIFTASIIAGVLNSLRRITALTLTPDTVEFDFAFEFLQGNPRIYRREILGAVRTGSDTLCITRYRRCLGDIRRSHVSEADWAALQEYFQL